MKKENFKKGDILKVKDGVIQGTGYNISELVRIKVISSHFAGDDPYVVAKILEGVIKHVYNKETVYKIGATVSLYSKEFELEWQGEEHYEIY
jgi:hypothetical protein